MYSAETSVAETVLIINSIRDWVWFHFRIIITSNNYNDVRRGYLLCTHNRQVLQVHYHTGGLDTDAPDYCANSQIHVVVVPVKRKEIIQFISCVVLNHAQGQPPDDPVVSEMGQNPPWRANDVTGRRGKNQSDSYTDTTQPALPLLLVFEESNRADLENGGMKLNWIKMEGKRIYNLLFPQWEKTQ